MKNEDILSGMYLHSIKTDRIVMALTEKRNNEFKCFCFRYKEVYFFNCEMFEPISFREAFKEEIEKEFEATYNEFTKEKLELVETNQGLQNQLNKSYDKVQALQHEINQSKKEFTNYTESNKTYYQYYKNEVEKNQLLRKENESLKHELKETITAYDELENKKFDTVTVSTATKINSLTESNRKLQQENSKLKNALVKMILEGSP